MVSEVTMRSSDLTETEARNQRARSGRRHNVAVQANSQMTAFAFVMIRTKRVYECGEPYVSG